MEIRPDFKEVGGLLERLLLYADQADKFNREDWGHYKSNEDYRKVYGLPVERRGVYERIYSDGRDCAVFMTFSLSSFNEVGDYPTLKSYVDSFADTFLDRVDELESFAQQASEMIEQHGSPWAVGRMLVLYRKQIEMLKATKEVLDELRDSKLYRGRIAASSSKVEGKMLDSVFIVHGHDGKAESEVARFVEKLGFNAIILHEQTSGSRTIIEKVEHYSSVGFGIVLYTPDDVGRKAEGGEDQPRARQNVVFEHGYLMGKLSRSSVVALVKGELEEPNDLSGIVYEKMDAAGAWKMKIAREMKDVGYGVDMNKLT